MQLSVMNRSRANKIDDMLPAILERLSAVQEVLAPLPKEVLEEAIYHTASYYIPIDSETELCRNHSALLFESFLRYEIWALKMVDASSKGSPGLLDGNVMDLGNYGQCISVEAPGELFTGQHCVIETQGIMPVDMDSLNPKRPVLPTLRLDLMFSVCVPSSCTPGDVKTHMDLALNSVNATAIIYNSSCSSASPIPFENKDYIAMLILILIALLIGLSTWFDKHSENSAGCKVIKCFSLVQNTRQLLDTSCPDVSDTIPCLRGLRILALAWLMLGYRMLHLLACPNHRFKYLVENIDNVAWAPVENAHLSVEIFLLVTGVHVTYKFFLQDRQGRKFRYFEFFLKYYLRLTFPLALVMLVYGTVAMHFTDGPIWRRLFEFLQLFCQKNWWSNLLYVSNYVNPYEMVSVLPQTWYLAIEFQLYALSPLLLLPLVRNPRRGLFFIAIAFLATIVGGIINSYMMEIQAGGLIRLDRTREGTNVLDYFYTQYRAASFLIGMALGFLLFRIKEDHWAVQFSKMQVLVGWVAALSLFATTVLAVSIFQDPLYVYTAWLDTAYGILHRPTLSLAVSWFILACSTGSGGFLNTILSWRPLLPLYRLSHCVFLVHFLVQDIQAFSTRTAITIDFLNLWYMVFADFFISHLVAVVVYLAVEAPVINLISLVEEGGKDTEERGHTSQPASFTKNVIHPEHSLHLEKL
ncbi:nose resistant to fluoxetine protein 6-like [Homalodisca vitripennis]|uniref:nose resistant to fluoxetine protein 6-like n=1 Tax=Homalodisca vitripennis TaxID=197043 RepID=UPI001EEC651C|nr:nose resistant to fluoxetine protein 6-like [Homalodisca vitripennis]